MVLPSYLNHDNAVNRQHQFFLETINWRLKPFYVFHDQQPFSVWCFRRVTKIALISADQAIVYDDAE